MAEKIVGNQVDGLIAAVDMFYMYFWWGCLIFEYHMQSISQSTHWILKLIFSPSLFCSGTYEVARQNSAGPKTEKGKLAETDSFLCDL